MFLFLSNLHVYPLQVLLFLFPPVSGFCSTLDSLYAPTSDCCLWFFTFSLWCAAPLDQFTASSLTTRLFFPLLPAKCVIFINKPLIIQLSFYIFNWTSPLHLPLPSVSRSFPLWRSPLVTAIQITFNKICFWFALCSACGSGKQHKFCQFAI